jgi:hypothetical protein
MDKDPLGAGEIFELSDAGERMVLTPEDRPSVVKEK